MCNWTGVIYAEVSCKGATYSTFVANNKSNSIFHWPFSFTLSMLMIFVNLCMHCIVCLYLYTICKFAMKSGRVYISATRLCTSKTRWRFAFIRKVVVRFVNIYGIVDHDCLNILCSSWFVVGYIIIQMNLKLTT